MSLPSSPSSSSSSSSEGPGDANLSSGGVPIEAMGSSTVLASLKLWHDVLISQRSYARHGAIRLIQNLLESRSNRILPESSLFLNLNDPG